MMTSIDVKGISSESDDMFVYMEGCICKILFTK